MREASEQIYLFPSQSAKTKKIDLSLLPVVQVTRSVIESRLLRREGKDVVVITDLVRDLRGLPA